MRTITAVVQDGATHAAAADGIEATPVPWWSFTKTVLAAAALALVADRRLALDGPVEGQPFSLRQLLQHRAGLADYGGLRAYDQAVAAGDAPWPRPLLLQRAGAGRLAFQPGRGWAYSNIGYMQVADLVARAAGQELGDALDRWVLRPLGIAGVRLARGPADLATTAWGNAAGYDPGWVYHGLLVGPAASAARLLHRLLGGGLLPASLLAEMLTAHPIDGAAPERPWRTAGYGLGMMVGIGDGGARYVGHTGAGPGSSAAIYQLDGEAGPRRTAAAFAPSGDPALVERRAMELTGH